MRTVNNNPFMPEVAYKPTISFNSEELPEVKDWEVGKTYKIVVEVKETSREENERRTVGFFEIQKVGVYNGKSVKDMSKSQFKKAKEAALEGESYA